MFLILCLHFPFRNWQIETLATTVSVSTPVVVPASDGSTISNVSGSPLFQQHNICHCSWFFPNPCQNGKANSRQKICRVKRIAFCRMFCWMGAPTSKRQRCCMEDIVTWTKGFTIFSLILTSYFPTPMDRSDEQTADHLQVSPT